MVLMATATSLYYLQFELSNGIVLLFTELPNALQHDRRTECKVSLLYCAYALQDSPAAASHRNRI
jgi:hypothetical protein